MLLDKTITVSKISYKTYKIKNPKYLLVLCFAECFTKCQQLKHLRGLLKKYREF